MAPTKICRKCGEEKSLAAFSVKTGAYDGLRSQCKLCLSEKNKAYYAANAAVVAVKGAAYRAVTTEKQKARSKAWSEKNRDKCAARSARYRQRHPDRVKAYSDANKDAQRVRGENWQKRNPEKARQKTAEYQRLHPEVGVEYRAKKRAHLDAAIQRWRDRNPEYRAGANARRRGRLVAAGGSHTVHEIAELMVRQGGRCANPFCGVEIHTKNKALDHIMPLALGGGNGIENLQWLCQPCNSRKSAIHPDRWLEKEAKLISSRV